ncbi:phosphotransferase [Candidatus Poribacteria bacterium]|nr:phosphotransferase [Candidatus Poribacteria bacterium]
MADDGTIVDTPARALHHVRCAFPELNASDARALDDGWASYPYMVDDTWVFRFPRAFQVERQYRKERRFLPRLAPRVTIAVPSIECVGVLPDGRAFMGHRAIHGEPLTRRGIDAMSTAARDAVIAQIVGYLRALHGFPSTKRGRSASTKAACATGTRSLARALVSTCSPLWARLPAPTVPHCSSSSSATLGTSRTAPW